MRAKCYEIMKKFLLLLLIFFPSVLSAHEVLHTIEKNKAYAVKVYFADGEEMSYAEFEIYSPEDPKIPYQKGRTDRSGYLSFVPDANGKWRVKVFEQSGHGQDVEIDTGGMDLSSSFQKSDSSNIAFYLRPVIGVSVIVLIFSLLYWINKKKRKTS
jgi:nickel transport protein